MELLESTFNFINLGTSSREMSNDLFDKEPGILSQSPLGVSLSPPNPSSSVGTLSPPNSLTGKKYRANRADYTCPWGFTTPMSVHNRQQTIPLKTEKERRKGGAS